MVRTLIHNDQLGEPAIVPLLASPPTRQSSWSAYSRDSTVVRSTSLRTALTAWRVRSTSGRPSSWAMATSTSAWDPPWFSHMRRMTDALVKRRPVINSTRSNTCLNVRLLGAVSIPSCWTTSRPAFNRRPCNSPRGCLVLPLSSFEGRADSSIPGYSAHRLHIPILCFTPLNVQSTRGPEVQQSLPLRLTCTWRRSF